MINIELIKGGKAPKRMSNGASAYDVYAREIYYTGDTVRIYLGFKLDISNMATEGAPFGAGAILMPRSGWGTKYGFRMHNTIGLIDMDYRGEVMMIASWDNGKQLTELSRDARVGQLIILPVYTGELTIVDSLEETERGNNGFGSTGDA
jgi:dUTP pyrophosphatase